MTKWEYLVVGGITVGYYHTGRPGVSSDSGAYRITSNGYESIKRFKNLPEGIDVEEEMGKLVAQLGEEGWEMTGVGNSSDHYHCLYFKRPKE